jgi:hypothetical protein
MCFNSSQAKVTSPRDSCMIIILIYSYLHYYLIIFTVLLLSQSQWPWGLRHELSLPAHTEIMGSNLIRGMDVCVRLFCLS